MNKKNSLIFIFSCLISIVLVGCKKENDTTIENYLKCEINGLPYLVAQNSTSYMVVQNSASFSFARGIYKNTHDTIYSIQVTLDSLSISISFPKTDKPKKFDIYRFTEITKSPSGTYQSIHKDSSNGIIVYHTINWKSDEDSNSQKVGEINIVRINKLTREILGTFYFRAFGYNFNEPYVNSINDSVTITKGEFFYQWPVNWKY
jgi:hypothetical protein